MKKIYPPVPWICMIVFWSCSTVRVSQDYQLETDFSNLKTYRWQPIAWDIQGDAPMDDPLRDERIQKTVERNLHAPETKNEKTDELVGKVLAQFPPASNHYELHCF